MGYWKPHSLLMTKQSRHIKTMNLKTQQSYWSGGQYRVINYAQDLGMALFSVSLLFPFEKGGVCTEREN